MTRRVAGERQLRLTLSRVTTTDLRRFLCERWNLLHAHEKVEALRMVREMARQEARRPLGAQEPSWSWRYEAVIEAQFLWDAEALREWRDARKADVEVEGTDPREATFLATVSAADVVTVGDVGQRMARRVLRAGAGPRRAPRLRLIRRTAVA